MERQQRRGRVIAMTAEELDAFLGEQHTCRFATTGPDGPHVAPVWFVWDGRAIWVYSLTRSQRWANVMGPVPRKGHEDCPELGEPERLMAAKYFGPEMTHDARHAWLRITPLKMVSWDF